MSKRSKNCLRIAHLQADQVQLCNMQAEIQQYLTKVNEAMNALKVEELTLNATIAESLEKSSSNIAKTQPQRQLACFEVVPTEMPENVAAVNQQILDLNTFMGHCMQEIEEEYD